MMTVIKLSEKRLPLPNKTALALGLFDGVHIGHRQLLAETTAVARQEGLLPAVFTFYDTAYKHAPALFSREETYRQMEALGIAYIFEADFAQIAHYSPTEFVQRILRDICNPRYVLCGENFRFGRDAEGDAETLASLFAEEGETLKVLPPVQVEGKTVSSSAIRSALLNGEIHLANAYLGQAYTLFGQVSHGKALGRTMHIPTVNIPIDPRFTIPKRGVYVGYTKFGCQVYPSVSNIGRRPTLENTSADNCETHLLDVAGDYYGQRAEVSLLSFLRDEKKFESKEQLAKQMSCDVAEAKAWFLAHPNALIFA